MLSSSKEYLQALRDEKYLLFLEWPQFIAEHYQEKSMFQDADDTVNLLAFEWLNNGYCEDDAKKIALLYAVYDLSIKPIRGNLAYALTAISVAVFQCMAYQSLNQHEQFVVKHAMKKEQILKLMTEQTMNSDKEALGNVLLKQQVIFYLWVNEVSKDNVEHAFWQISPLAQLRYLIDDYCLALESSQLINDSLKNSRLSVIRRLARYLNEETALTPPVKNEITIYVTKIRKMQPADFENVYLEALSPSTLMDNTWTFITGIGLSFFKFVQPQKTVSAKAEQKQNVAPAG